MNYNLMLGFSFIFSIFIYFIVKKTDYREFALYIAAGIFIMDLAAFYFVASKEED